VGGGRWGNGKKARAGLVRACLSHQGVGFEAERWAEVSRIYRRLLGMALQRNSGQAEVTSRGGQGSQSRRGGVTKNTAELLASQDNETVLPDLGLAAMLCYRIRYFSDGAVIGSRAFVNEAFEAARERFTAHRRDGARRFRGQGKPAAGVLWSMRDLRTQI
jgi:hypothetical protein